MTMLRISILTTVMGLGILSGASPAMAQNSPSPQARQAASELVSLVSAGMLSDMAAKMTDQAWPSVESSLLNRNPKLDAGTIADLRKEFERLIVNAMSEIMNDAPELYARYFTVQEMHELVAFYRTPTGAKTLKIMPQVTTEFAATMVPRLQSMAEKVNLAFLTILQKRGYYGQ
jgi:uncharacterized protein